MQIPVLLLVSAILLMTVTNAKLHQVVSQFRHGARYPVNSEYDGN